MHEAQEKLARCPHCGQSHPAAESCPVPGEVVESGHGGEAHAEWRRVRDSLKIRWVASVVAFWVSVAVTVVVYFIKERLDLVLASICLGLLIVGVWLKARYQMHLRQDPGGD